MSTIFQFTSVSTVENWVPPKCYARGKVRAGLNPIISGGSRITSKITCFPCAEKATRPEIEKNYARKRKVATSLTGQEKGKTDETQIQQQFIAFHVFEFGQSQTLSKLRERILLHNSKQQQAQTDSGRI